MCCSFFFFNSKILCFVRGAKLLRNFKWLSCKVSFVTLWNASEVTILEQERCGFLHFEVYLVTNNSLFLFFFKWEILRFIRELFLYFFEKYIYIFSGTDYMFEIKTTRNFEGTNKLPNLKFAMLYLQNCDL